MDNETRELFNALIGELDRVEQKIHNKLDDVSNKLDTLQRDVNILN